MSITDQSERFKIIDGGKGNQEPEPPRKRAYKRKTPRLMVCPECKSSTSVEVRTGRMLTGNKLSAGTKQVVCAFCLAKGKLTDLV